MTPAPLSPRVPGRLHSLNHRQQLHKNRCNQPNLTHLTANRQPVLFVNIVSVPLSAVLFVYTPSALPLRSVRLLLVSKPAARPCTLPKRISLTAVLTQQLIPRSLR